MQINQNKNLSAFWCGFQSILSLLPSPRHTFQIPGFEQDRKNLTADMQRALASFHDSVSIKDLEKIKKAINTNNSASNKQNQSSSLPLFDGVSGNG